jgi:hypothetical protein
MTSFQLPVAEIPSLRFAPGALRTVGTSGMTARLVVDSDLFGLADAVKRFWTLPAARLESSP